MFPSVLPHLGCINLRSGLERLSCGFNSKSPPTAWMHLMCAKLQYPYLTSRRLTASSVEFTRMKFFFFI